MDQVHFRKLITRVLLPLEMYSIQAVELLMGTTAQESGLGRWLYQVGGGPGLGFFQMEPATERDIWHNYLRYRPLLVDRIVAVCNVAVPGDWHLETNLAYQVAMARLQYMRVASPLPDPKRIDDMAFYWKRHYNTEKGKGTPQEFVHNYFHYCM